MERTQELPRAQEQRRRFQAGLRAQTKVATCLPLRRMQGRTETEWMRSQWRVVRQWRQELAMVQERRMLPPPSGGRLQRRRFQAGLRSQTKVEERSLDL